MDITSIELKFNSKFSLFLVLGSSTTDEGDSKAWNNYFLSFSIRRISLFLGLAYYHVSKKCPYSTDCRVHLRTWAGYLKKMSWLSRCAPSGCQCPKGRSLSFPDQLIQQSLSWTLAWSSHVKTSCTCFCNVSMLGIWEGFRRSSTTPW